MLRGEERGGLLARNKDAVLSSCGFYFEEEEDAWCISILPTVKSQLLKAYPSTNKDAGRNALPATYRCSRQGPAPGVCVGSTPGASDRHPHPTALQLLTLPFLLIPPQCLRAAFEPLTSGGERQGWRDASRCGGSGRGSWINPCCASPSPGCPPQPPGPPPPPPRQPLLCLPHPARQVSEP